MKTSHGALNCFEGLLEGKVEGYHKNWYFSFSFLPPGPVMKALVSIISPIYWTTAKEIGEALNGFSLTNAVFKRETQVEFATGWSKFLFSSGMTN